MKIHKLAGFCALICSTAAFGHATVQPKAVLDAYNGRNYQEGTSDYASLQVPHGCGENDTQSVLAIFPNGVDLAGAAATTDSSGAVYNGNAIMSISPVHDAAWRITKQPGAVLPFYSHGLQGIDTKSILWRSPKGAPDLEHDHVGLFQFRATFPKLTGCVSKLTVRIPVLQYCKGRTVNAWIPEATPSIPEAIITPGFSPALTVVRDPIANPLPSGCGTGTDVTAYPPVQDIEAALPSFHNNAIANGTGN